MTGTIISPSESPAAEFQLHLSEENVIEQDNPSYQAVTSHPAKAIVARPKLSSKWSRTFSSLRSRSASSYGSRDSHYFSEPGSFRTELGDASPAGFQSSLTTPLEQQEEPFVTEGKAHRRDRSSSKSAISHEPSIPELTPVDSYSELSRQISEHRRLDERAKSKGKFSAPGVLGAEIIPDLAQAQTLSPVKPTEEVKTLDLRKRSNNSSLVNLVAQKHEDVASEDGIAEQGPIDPTTAARDQSRTVFNLSDPVDYYEAASQGIFECVTTATPKPRADATDVKLSRTGRRRILLQKHGMQFGQVAINGVMVFSTWWWMRYYYVLLPFITATVALNVIMIASIITRKTWNSISPEEKIIPTSPESLVMIVPCYNETREELLKSLNSLVSQDGIDQHKRAIIITCDGKVRGPGMEKTTANYLLHDILTNVAERVHLRGGYLAWDQQFMDVVVQTGTYAGVPYMCIVKQQNQGKRDSLILVRSFLYKFNMRATIPNTILSSRLFARMTKFLLEAGFENVDSLIGMDADTVFESQCIQNLITESRYPKTVGVSGYVMVDFTPGQWSIWRLYQSAEYTIAQGLRRLHQSLVTKKVSCLPGCCQLLKICEETCGDEVLVEKFGYCPGVKDGLLAHIRATASEDRNHVCHMLSARPNAETRQALAARAITDVPHSWSVFLSQRRRWTLGATSNDLFLAFAPGVQWFERILAIVNVMTWFLSPFIIASLASFIYAMWHVPVGIVMAFVGAMLIPILYYLCIPMWITKSWRERVQFWMGCSLYIFLGPFLSITVLIYACWNMDSFGWGKTRKVIATDDSKDETSSNFNMSETSSTRNDKVISTNPEVPNFDRVTAVAEQEKTVGSRS